MTRGNIRSLIFLYVSLDTSVRAFNHGKNRHSVLAFNHSKNNYAS